MSAPWRIALVAPFGLRAKGTTRARVLPLGRALAQRGQRVALFIPPYDSPEDAGRRWETDGVEVINLPLQRVVGASAGIGHAWLGRRLAGAVQAWGPDVVHAFKPKGPSGVAAALLWARRARPVVIVDADDWEGPGGWNDDPRAGYSPAARRFFAWQERHGLSHADAWTVTSACLRERAVAFGADGGRVFQLPNGIPAAAIRPAGARAPVPDSVLLYTRFAGVRPADVAAIWERVRVLVPSARLTVIGRGLAGEEAVLARLPGVEIAGWAPAEELPDRLARYAVALAPWADTPTNRARHSAKVLELMAAGVPVVAAVVGELPATLGECGVLVPPDDADAFARAVAELLTDPERAERLGAGAQARVGARFTWERLVETACAAYIAGSERRSPNPF